MSSTVAARLAGARVLVIGGAGSIGASTVAKLSAFDLAALHIVDQNENGLAELVRDLRSRAEGLDVRDFYTLPLDFGCGTMRRFLFENPPYDYVLNFAAVKHVRTEKDSYALLHMFDTNVVKPRRLFNWLSERGGTKGYFCVSTDKAANPVNLMGASKRLMEHVIFASLPTALGKLQVNSARFANVAFSDGSLLDGWLRRLEKRQPLAVPTDTRRFFISLSEAGQICLLAAMCAPSHHLIIPRLHPESDLHDLQSIAEAFLRKHGYEPCICESEAEARAMLVRPGRQNEYPLLVTRLDTMGEKSFEEFVGEGEVATEVGMPNLLGVKYKATNEQALAALLEWLEKKVAGEGETPPKAAFVSELSTAIPELAHMNGAHRLDDRM